MKRIFYILLLLTKFESTITLWRQMNNQNTGLQWTFQLQRRQKPFRKLIKWWLVIFDSYGSIFGDYPVKDKTINGKYYVGLLQGLDQEFKNKRPHLTKMKILFHHDNAPAHGSAIAMAKLHELEYELFPHLLYSPDIKWPGGRKFSWELKW